MSRELPVPIRPEKPDVVVVGSSPSAAERRAGALARLAVNLTPEVLDAVERAMNNRRARTDDPGVIPAPRFLEGRAHTQAIQHSEMEINTWAPFPRRVRVRTTTEWTSNTPVFAALTNPSADERGSRRSRAGLSALGLGGALALATLGVLANRGGRLRRR